MLSNPVLLESFEAVERDLYNQMRHVKLDDKDGHTRLVMALQINDAVRKQLWLMIQDGAAANQEIRLRGKRID